MSFASALLQAVTAIVLVAVVAVLIGATAKMMGDTVRVIEVVSYVTNVATGLFFVAGARGEKSLIQEVAEKRSQFPDRADVRYFFRLFTLA